MSPRKVHVLVVDDHDVVHWGFRLLLSNQEWVAECTGAGSAAEALEAVRARPVDVALIDLFLGPESGAELCEEIRALSPSTRVLLISGAGQLSASAARAAGAAGFVSKAWAAADVAMAVRMVSRGMTVFEPSPSPAATTLSQRERAVLRAICTGASNPEIATDLHLSPHTVKEYASTLYRKLGVRNRAQAAKRAAELGLTE